MRKHTPGTVIGNFTILEDGPVPMLVWVRCGCGATVLMRRGTLQRNAGCGWACPISKQALLATKVGVSRRPYLRQVKPQNPDSDITHGTLVGFDYEFLVIDTVKSRIYRAWMATVQCMECQEVSRHTFESLDFITCQGCKRDAERVA